MYSDRLRRTLCVALLSVGALVAASCGEDDEPTAFVVTDGDVIAVALALNVGELATSGTAEGRTENEVVLDFAGMMITEHTAVIDALEALGITPRESNLSQQQALVAEAVADALGGFADAQFDSVYIDVQIEQHQGALELLDNVLLPDAQDPTFLAELEAMRSMVAVHLEQAEEIQAAMLEPAT